MAKARFQVPSHRVLESSQETSTAAPEVLAEAIAAARDVPGVGRALFTFLKQNVPGDSILIALYDQATQERTCVYFAGDVRRG